MVINVVSTHRFHLLDLARELSVLGHDVHYYSYVPKRRCAQFGLDPSLITCFIWLVWPFFVIDKILPQKAHERLMWVRNHLIDSFVAKTMRPCDVLIGIGYVYQKSFLTAKKKWKSLTVLEWGSLHIVEQITNYGLLENYPKWKLAWELNGYQVCDYISIPSIHAKKTFLMHDFPDHKLFVNPYGVNMNLFLPTECTAEYDLIYVGGWRLEKGCDLITELCLKYGYRFLHVGSIVNLDFPNINNMTHIDSVDECTLPQYYTKAKVFIFPSKADGFGMVLLQALVCGLPIVSSGASGGPDLKLMLDGSPMVSVVDSLAPESWHKEIDQALIFASQQNGRRSYIKTADDSFSWSAYGKRYDAFLQKMGK